MKYLFALLCCFSLPALAGEWQLHSNRDGVEVFTAEVPGQNLKAFRGVAVIDAPMDKVLDVLADLPRMPSWFYQMRRAELVSGNPTEGRIYFVIAGIWPVSDRDAVIDVDTHNINDAVMIQSIGRPAAKPAQSCCVRIPSLQSSWLVSSLSSTQTQVIFTTQSHPGGVIPLWLANRVAVDMPRQTLNGLRREVMQ
ncbi:MAG: START domain-containing protein [Moraxellaceae bacterium]|nr:START domain-containing protein [Moraxellaceae bacterium]MDP1776111.1 START domain-containing protein [Moraxellaceae bacterium]